MRRLISVNSNLNSKETNILNTSNRDDVIGNSNLSCIKDHTKILLKKSLLCKKKLIHMKPLVSIYEMTDDNNTSE